ncbi:MAG: leucine-rich repeat domain-containing protein [Chitinophagales bacterium]|nr:leucine-rich repeat domain-containing protein [Chitinophagales bacterium]
MSQLAKNLIARARTEGWKRLELGNCGLTDLEAQVPELFELQHLEELVLSNKWWDLDKQEWIKSDDMRQANKLSQLPQAMAQLTQLKVLVCGGRWNDIWTISDIGVLKYLTQLTILDLWDNEISDIGVLKKLTQLTNLALGNNQITNIDVLQSLTQLTNLYLSSNKISDIGVLQYLTQLTNLDLGSNKISDIGVLQSLTQLTTLDLSTNRISDIGVLQSLTQLTNLVFSNNKISNIGVLQSLTQLTTLDLSLNKISDIGVLKYLTQLTNLYLSYNKISDIGVLQSLTQLTTLHLWSNQINDLSPLLTHYKKGVVIDVANNPLVSPPLEIVDQGNDAIIRWLEEYIANDNLPLQQAKLLILGAGGVGKTSLMHKLCNPNSSLPAQAATTVGITVVTQPVVYTIAGSEYTLYIWDFGGQDVYHPTHQFFLTKNSVYVLMEDGREKKTDFYYWLQVQELLAGDSPLFVLQNIRNKSRSAIPINELKAKFGNIKEYFELDLSEVDNTHKGFSAMVAELQTKLKNLPHIGELWPRKRYEIREALLNKKNEQYISLKQYRQLCNEHNYSETERQNDLLQQLHFLGVVLHFANEPFLQDIVITDPQWATDAVYAILDHTEKHYEKKGHFTYNDLCTVWHKDCYEGKFPQLLALMEKFELSFPLPDAPHTYITPLLLPDDKPIYDWDTTNSLQLRYTYDFMPKGILARLIVRKHELIKDHLFWKRGVVLHYLNTEAQVTEDYEGKNLSVSIKGSEAKGLMYEISREIDRINSTYHFSEHIRAIKRVPCSCATCKIAKEPHFYNYEELKGRQTRGKQTIECKNPPYDDVNVQMLLDDSGVEGKIKLGGNAISIFISYAQEDHEHLQTLKDHLSSLTRQSKITVWYDQEILAGKDWNKEIEQHLQNAVVVVLLISSDFLSDRKQYIWDKEMPIIMQKHHNGQLVIPVVVRDCNWQWDEQLAEIQAVNGGKALNSEADKDAAFAAAARQIKQAIS